MHHAFLSLLAPVALVNAHPATDHPLAEASLAFPGLWEGSFTHAGLEHAFRLEILEGPEDVFWGVLHGVQGEGQVPVVGIVTIEGAWTRMDWRTLGITYEGRMEACGDSIVGRCLQSDSMPLVLNRVEQTGTPRFPSGGWLSELSGDHARGHVELTQGALRTLGFSKDAIAIAADASQDPDFYEWLNPAAHAQTGCDDHTGATNQTTPDSVARYIHWVEFYSQKFLHCAKPEHALFYLGYLLHGIQDLAAHRGVTNAQHAFETFIDLGKEKDCDHNLHNFNLAQVYSLNFLKGLLAKYPNFTSLKKFRASCLCSSLQLSKKEKEKLLEKPHWDLTLQRYREYKELAPAYQKIKVQNPRVVWEDIEVYAQILNSIP